ncbi:hypothetical protein WHR41_09384 [Cladosporium halotolerans]|uniref:Uncharacterized protein n=1 Tax=Cladosporium halotolerans TaxID=1052096 RepID=A0AB34KDZ8_9PEZI
MSVESDTRHDNKRQDILQSTPKVHFFLKPIAPSAALRLAGFTLSKAAGALEPHSVHTDFPELASWFVVLCVFTWSSALAASARDIVLTACLTSLALGSTISPVVSSPTTAERQRAQALATVNQAA